jgi:hypothetical protein
MSAMMVKKVLFGDLVPGKVRYRERRRGTRREGTHQSSGL